MTEPPAQPELRRIISLPLLVLYGLGVTIGAGIYVLIGETAAQAGTYAPASFLIAAAVMAFSAASFAELSGRFPQAAGEAIYVREGLGFEWLSILTALAIVLGAIVAAATITLGGAGYVQQLLPASNWIIVTAIVMLMGGIGAWGVLESVSFAAVFTILEILGLVIVIVAGFVTQPDILTRLPQTFPSLSNGPAWLFVFNASLVAFFAFIGFDDVVNLVEETADPRRVMPKAILITLVAATVIYYLVASVAVLAVPMQDLVESPAPIRLLFERLTGASPLLITLIAIVATLNGIVIQIVMAARVLYGMGKKGSLPAVFARVHPVSRTPVLSTILVTACVLVMALFFPIGQLAAWTTQLILGVFALVNLSLFRIKLHRRPAPEGAYTTGLWVPACGFILCLILLAGPELI